MSLQSIVHVQSCLSSYNQSVHLLSLAFLEPSLHSGDQLEPIQDTSQLTLISFSRRTRPHDLHPAVQSAFPFLPSHSMRRGLTYIDNLRTSVSILF